VNQIEHMRARGKGFSAGIVLSSRFQVTLARGLLPNPAKIPYTIVQKFYADGETDTEISILSLLTLLPNGHVSVKVPKF
jgi:hypothetical protein